jgi:hypothetical protein
VRQPGRAGDRQIGGEQLAQRRLALPGEELGEIAQLLHHVRPGLGRQGLTAASAFQAGRPLANPVKDSRRSHSLQNCQIVCRVRGSAKTRSSARAKPSSVVSAAAPVAAAAASRSSSGVDCQKV